MANEKLREEFESLFRELHKDDKPRHAGMLLNIGADGEYLFHRTRTLFSFYQAGVASQQEKLERQSWAVRQLLMDMPAKRDWLDPRLEDMLREIASSPTNEPEGDRN